MNLKSLEYFSHRLLEPMYELDNVLQDRNHPEYVNVMYDINHIDNKELQIYVENNKPDIHIFDKSNLDFERRKMYLQSRLLYNGIAMKRKELLSSSVSTFKEIGSLNFTDDNLLDLSSFSYERRGLVYGNWGYRLCPTIKQDNSSYWLFQTLMYLSRQGKNIFIRLDPLIEIPINEYNPIQYRMDVYRSPLKWNQIKQLKNENHGQFMDNCTNAMTDYIWKPSDNEIHFTCEELPPINDCEYRGSRYFHAIIDKSTGQIMHCDGAVRFYNLEELETRNKLHLKDSGARKMGKRIKIFRIDDILEQSLFTQLVSSFYVWNDDVNNYMRSICC